MAQVYGLLLLLASLLTSNGALGQPPADLPAPPGLEASADTGEDHVAVLAPYQFAPGRPDWAPLEVAWGAAEYREYLEAILRQGLPADRPRAALGLALTGAQGSRDLLAQVMSSSPGDTRQWAGLALCYLGDVRGVSEARRALNVAPAWIRYYALVGLWRLDSPDVRAFLRGSKPTQGPFLSALIPRALQSAPWTPPGLQHSLLPPPAEATPPQLWEHLTDQMVVTSDYWWHQGDYDQCCQAMEAAVFFRPDRVDLFDSIAWLQWSLGRDAVAIETLNRGLAANPDSWLAHYNLGFHYFNTKRYEESLACLRTAAQTCDTWCVPAHMYAHARESAKRPQEALQVWEDCVKRFPNDEVGRRNLERLRKSRAGGQ